MRYASDHKPTVRQRLLRTAAAMYRKHGLAGASLATLMRRIGLTHGGFYDYFATKDELAAAACIAAFRETADEMEQACRAAGGGARVYVERMLCQFHVDHPEKGCVCAALATEVARSNKVVRAGFTEGFRSYITRLAEFMPGETAAAREDRMLAVAATAVGAVVIARALADPNLTRRVRHSARHMLESVNA